MSADLDLKTLSEWIRIAEIEYERAERFLEQEDVFAAYPLHQAVENALYALMLMEGWTVEEEPTLGSLISAAIEQDRSLRPYWELCLRIEEMSFAARFPSTAMDAGGATATLERLRRSMDEARPLLDGIAAQARKRLNEDSNAL